MADELELRHATPKRKRGQDSLSVTPIYTTAQFSFRPFDPSIVAEDVEDGSASPRSKVAQHFRGLAINDQQSCQQGLQDQDHGGGGVGTSTAAPPLHLHRADAQSRKTSRPMNAKSHQGQYTNAIEKDRKKPESTWEKSPLGLEDGDDDADGSVMRKRRKVPDLVMSDAGTIADIPPTSPSSVVDTRADATAPAALSSPKSTRKVSFHPEPEPQPEPIWVKSAGGDDDDSSRTTTGQAGELRYSYPSINRLQDSKSREPPKRAGTPPLIQGRKKKEPRNSVDPTVSDSPHGSGVSSSSGEEDENEAPEVVDPVRAALTWHEDEITVYDPDDSEDDGTGVNGIGFKPTPALARIRTQKRKQQMIEYRKREEKDARAMRVQRRRAPGGGEGASAAGKRAAAAARRVRFRDIETPTTLTTEG